MPTIIKGQPTSAEIRKRLKAEGRPVVLSCSLGKDSLAAWVALEDEGIEVVPISTGLSQAFRWSSRTCEPSRKCSA